jgi:hypothetical protein
MFRVRWDLDGPPALWRVHLVSGELRVAEWGLLSTKQRYSAWRRSRKKEKQRRTGHRVGATPKRSKIYAQRQGMKRSAAALAFQLQHAKGCSIEGCPLGPPQSEERQMQVLLERSRHCAELSRAVLLAVQRKTNRFNEEAYIAADAAHVRAKAALAKRRKVVHHQQECASAMCM